MRMGVPSTLLATVGYCARNRAARSAASLRVHSSLHTFPPAATLRTDMKNAVNRARWQRKSAAFVKRSGSRP